ncbi:MAG: hypothetical protein RIR21_877 [Pseudomonadota bacterium]|jgi:hypothetical protein
MKKKLFCLLALCSVTGWVHADWSRVEHSSKELSLYVDSETRQDSGRGTIVLWHLVDFKSNQDLSGSPYRSIKGQDEYDCEKGVRRDMFHLWHQDSMGASTMVHAAYKPGPWTTPAQGSVEQTLMRLACSK